MKTGAETIVACTWKACGQPATHKFRWEWGEEGECCAACVTLMQQTSESLSRRITFSTLGPVEPQPLTRDERTLLIAARLSAEAECDELKTRGHELYTANVDLTQQVQTHVMRAREHDGQIMAKEHEIEALLDKIESRERELADTSAELQRLRMLAPFTERGKTQPPEGRSKA